MATWTYRRLLCHRFALVPKSLFASRKILVQEGVDFQDEMLKRPHHPWQYCCICCWLQKSPLCIDLALHCTVFMHMNSCNSHRWCCYAFYKQAATSTKNCHKLIFKVSVEYQLLNEQDMHSLQYRVYLSPRTSPNSLYSWSQWTDWCWLLKICIRLRWACLRNARSLQHILGSIFLWKSWKLS